MSGVCWFCVYPELQVEWKKIGEDSQILGQIVPLTKHFCPVSDYLSFWITLLHLLSDGTDAHDLTPPVTYAEGDISIH